MIGKIVLSLASLIFLPIIQSRNCQVSPSLIENLDLKCVPALLRNEASPSTACILACKSNPLKFKHRCNRDGHWDSEPGSKTCDDIKSCENPWFSWPQWTWKCSLGDLQGSTCFGTCSTNPDVQAKIICQSNESWKHNIDPDQCKAKSLLLVSTGKNSYGNLLSSTEVLDLEDSTSTCQPLVDFVYPVYRAVGGLVFNGIPMLCNGINHEIGSGNCYTLNHNSLKISADLRLYGASVMVNDSIWITGGSANGSELTTSILVNPNGETKQGPDLPIAVRDHCMVGINDNEYFLIGGYPNGNRTFKYNFATEEWTPGPDLLNHRQEHACGLFTDMNDGKRKIIVSGGLGNTPPPYQPTSEILNFHSETETFELGIFILQKKTHKFIIQNSLF